MNKISTDVSINFLCCTDLAVMLIGEGNVYIYGEDHLHTGILGIPQFKSEIPVKIQVNAYVVTGSLYNHAAVIDNNGRLFTWGAAESGQTGHNAQDSSIPTLVDNGNLFRAKEVVCGEKFTGVLTDGCYVYIYGCIGISHRTNRKSLKSKILPSSHPELERMSAIEIAAGADFLCVLIEGGEVYAYDNCMDLVKLPLPQGVSVQKISSCREMAYGLGEGEIIE